MTDFNVLRNRYAETLRGRDTDTETAVKCVKRSDSYVSRYLENFDLYLNKIIDSREPDRINSLLRKLLDMSVSFSQSSSRFYRDTDLKNIIIESLNRLKDLYNDKIEPWGNWWYWEIGIPMSLNSILTLMYEHLKSEDIEFYMSAECHFNDKIKMTGANRLWESVIFAVRGILTEDSKTISEAVSGIRDVMVISEEGDGFYEDGSFIQHGNIPYNCGYGRSLIQELSPMFYVFRDTEFDIKDKSIVGYWIENSYLPFIYNGRAMDMVRGREISRYYEQTDFAYMKIISAILILCELDEFAYIRGRIKALITKGFFELSSAFAAELASSLLKDRSVQREESAPYFRSFNTMDRAVKYGKDYAVSLSMHSERIAAFESINNENQNAYHTSDGMMHIYKENEPRSDIFWPTIDLERLSGTTTVKNSHEKPNVNASGDFTGGCGINEYGVCAMKMVSEENSLRANKAWFFFDNDIVCLGSNINCRDGQNVETVIENRLVTDNSRFTIHGIEDGKGYLISGAYLNGIYDIGYYFPEEQKVSVVREVRKGAWSNISSKTDGRIYEDMYVTMWIDHGKDPKNESYAYIVIPKCDEGEIEDYYNKSGINIIENSDSIQCVKKNNVTAAVFLKDRTRGVEGINCESRCVIITEKKENSLELSAADITHKKDKLYIELDYSAEKVISRDERINVISIKPYICMEINTKDAKGREQHVVFGGVNDV